MIRVAFTMKLHPGCEAEYRRRHDAIWPELARALRAAGIVDYAIYLDRRTGTLFAVQARTDDHRVDELAEEPVMRRWWAYMADLMETYEDDSPVTDPLSEVFRLA